jgi:exonuclease III
MLMDRRYIEADVFGLRVASVYLPNGNPVPSPNFDYKLAWFERFNCFKAPERADFAGLYPSVFIAAVGDCFGFQ